MPACLMENIETLEKQQAELDQKTRQMEGELTPASHLQQALSTHAHPFGNPNI